MVTNSELQQTAKRIQGLVAKKEFLTQELESCTVLLQTAQDKLQQTQAVQEIFQTAIRLLYQNLSSKLGDIITEGLSIVFPDSPYRFVIDFVERRGTIEADLFLEDPVAEEKRFHPLADVGGGIADFVSLLLRITYIILSKYDNILIADEPLKFLDRTRIEDAARFVVGLCKEFQFQILCVTHIPEFVENAEISYEVRKNKSISVLKKLTS